MQELIDRNSILVPCTISSLETPVIPMPPCRLASATIRKYERCRPSAIILVTWLTSPLTKVRSPEPILLSKPSEITHSELDKAIET